MDQALQKEQDRQMAIMHDKQKHKNHDLAKQRMMKQLKLAEIQKKKTADAQRARELQYLQGTGQTAEEEATLIVKNEALDNCKEKCQLMSKLVYKAAYSRPIQYKR